jgi:hypothetical protein
VIVFIGRPTYTCGISLPSCGFSLSNKVFESCLQLKTTSLRHFVNIQLVYELVDLTSRFELNYSRQAQLQTRKNWNSLMIRKQSSSWLDDHSLCHEGGFESKKSFNSFDLIYKFNHAASGMFLIHSTFHIELECSRLLTVIYDFVFVNKIIELPTCTRLARKLQLRWSAATNFLVSRKKSKINPPARHKVGSQHIFVGRLLNVCQWKLN